jgi:hypothetical protein
MEKDPIGSSIGIQYPGINDVLFWLFCDLSFVHQLLILNTLFLWLQTIDLDKQGL